MSQNQNGIWSGVSVVFSVNFFSIELGPRGPAAAAAALSAAAALGQWGSEATGRNLEFYSRVLDESSSSSLPGLPRQIICYPCYLVQQPRPTAKQEGNGPLDQRAKGQWWENLHSQEHELNATEETEEIFQPFDLSCGGYSIT